MEIPSAGISWLYTAGFISSAVDMEKNMSSYSPYGKYDVGKRGKQSYNPCSLETVGLTRPKTREPVYHHE